MRWGPAITMAMLVAAGCGSESSSEDGAGGTTSTSVLRLTVNVQSRDRIFVQETAYLRYTQDLRAHLVTLQEHGARFTWDLRDLADAAGERGDDLVGELLAAGQSVGLHADLASDAQPGGGYDLERFTEELTALRASLQAAGATPRHVSGICNGLDWVTAAADAGFEAIVAPTAWCLQSIGANLQPDDAPTCDDDEACPQPWPPGAGDSLHSWSAAGAINWTEATDGKIRIVPAATDLICAAEQRAGQPLVDCVPDSDDVDAAMLDLEARLDLVSEERVNVHVIVWRWGKDLEGSLVEALLERVAPYLESGRVEWTTVDDLLDLE